MKNMILYACCIFSIVAVSLFVLIMVGNDSDINIKFLSDYGWKVSGDIIEKEKIEIPIEFDDVYNNYNELQKQAGLDLSLYKGKKAIRYTYLVTNYPHDVGEPVRANVICVMGKPIAGDIMTVSINGFMHSLRFPT